MTPADRQLLSLLLSQGVEIDPTEYDAFLAELRMRHATEPGEGPQAGLETLVILSLVLSVGLTIAASFFKPKPQTPGSGGLRSREKIGDTINRARSFAPRYGFDSIQEPATMGSTIPVVYAERRDFGLDSVDIAGEAAAILNGIGGQWRTPAFSGQRSRFIGGIRVNTPLLFSRVRNDQGGQTLSAIFLIGEGAISQLDCDCFAIGNTSLAGYRVPLKGRKVNDPQLGFVSPAVYLRRYSAYFRRYGGRIVGTDLIQGRHPVYDTANMENEGAPDVFAVRSAPDNRITLNTAFAQKPSTNVVFGLYGFIPNNMAVRVSPRVRPTITLRTEPQGDDGGFRVKVDDDPQALAEFWKSKYFWSGRAGIIEFRSFGGGYFIRWSDEDDDLFAFPETSFETLASGGFFIYMLSARSDEQTRIHFDQTNTDGEKADIDANLKCGDIAGIVSSRQRAADQAIVIGELYKFGGIIAQCVGRSYTKPEFDSGLRYGYGLEDPEPFVSDSDETPGNGRDIYYTFMIVRMPDRFVFRDAAEDEVLMMITRNEIRQPDRTGDQVDPPDWDRRSNMADIDNNPRFRTGTNGAHGFRCALGNITTPRATKAIEIGIKSTLGITISGYTNFRDCDRLDEINERAGSKLDGDNFGKNEKINVQNFTSGTVTTNEYRWSFFRLWTAPEGELLQAHYNHTFAVRGIGSQPVFNEIRMFFSETQRYDIMFEPISGFEARYVITGTVLWLDSAIPETLIEDLENIDSIQYTVAFRGKRLGVADLAGYMRISALEPKKDIGYGWADGKSMFDSWGAAAEAFIYPEITSTAEQGPEHEITYVNTINTQDAQPTHNYDKLSIVGLNIRAAAEWTQFSQFSAYIIFGRIVERLMSRLDASVATGGALAGSSNLFPEILYDLLLNPTFGTGAYINSAQIDKTDFYRATLWCEARNYYCDIAISQKTNLRQWAADMAAMHLLELTQKDGKFSLQPALVFAAPVPIAALFTAGNIVEGSFAMEFLERDEREPIQVAAVWREERNQIGDPLLFGVDNIQSRGFFAQERTVLVREATTPENAALETIDMSDFCTNVHHAIDAAAYVIRVRRLVTHSIRFRCTPDNLVAVLGTGDYIRVAMDTTFYDEFANGVILADGTVVTTRPELMTPGSHACTVWDGSSNPPSDVTITVQEDGTVTSPRGVVFVRKTVTSQVRTYKIESLSITQDMEIEIEAVEHPTDSAGYSRLAKNFPNSSGRTDAYWYIDQG